jgi:hypothetical protein
MRRALTSIEFQESIFRVIVFQKFGEVFLPSSFHGCITNDARKQAREHECEPVCKNKYIWNILMIRIDIFRISLCCIKMTWKIFFCMNMDESQKMDDFFYES